MMEGAIVRLGMRGYCCDVCADVRMPSRCASRKGGALLMALWTIAVLSVMVLSFVFEAHQQSGINVYVRERNRVNRLTEAGKAIAEVVLLNYTKVSDWSEDQDIDKMLEEDRWVREKQNLKAYGKCTIGPIALDDENPEAGIVTIDIESANSGSDGIININQLYSGGGDGKYMERWWMIFQSHGIPEELSTPKDGTINLWNILIASWNGTRTIPSPISMVTRRARRLNGMRITRKITTSTKKTAAVLAKVQSRISGSLLMCAAGEIIRRC